MARRASEETVDRAFVLEAGELELCLSIVRAGHEAIVLELPVGRILSVGRDREASIRIGSPSLSRLHLAVELTGAGATLRDLGSRNGTRLNGELVGADDVHFSPADVVIAGDVQLALVRRSTLPSAARPFSLLPELQAALLRSSREATLTLIELTGDQTPANQGVFELLRALPESARVGFCGDDCYVVATEASVALWLRQGLTQKAGALARLWLSPAGLSGRQLVLALEQVLNGQASEATPQESADIPEPFRYPSLVRLHSELRRVAPRALSVLLLGETGTGKEVFARELHRLSGRSGPLVAVNTATLPENLIESELFGHERGAFSGAVTAKAGLIESADKGTLFLDEIGELPLPLQAKLLRVLEEQTVRRVGANQERKVDLRVVAATHQDLTTLALEKKFRQDLLFRLNGVSLRLPPLRERATEVGALARFFLRTLAAKPPQLTPAADARLASYAWPGNVRELKHVMERAIAFCDGTTIDVEHLPEALHTRTADPPPTSDANVRIPDVRSSVKDFERERILAALRETGGNRTKAAELLGLPRRTLVYKLSKLNLDES
jgi:two-component system response regulator AtoC